jgi:hypothetical protein
MVKDRRIRAGVIASAPRVHSDDDRPPSLLEKAPLGALLPAGCAHDGGLAIVRVIAGLMPVIPIGRALRLSDRKALRLSNRDGRDEPTAVRFR